MKPEKNYALKRQSLRYIFLKLCPVFFIAFSFSMFAGAQTDLDYVSKGHNGQGPLNYYDLVVPKGDSVRKDAEEWAQVYWDKRGDPNLENFCRLSLLQNQIDSATKLALASLGVNHHFILSLVKVERRLFSDLCFNTEIDFNTFKGIFEDRAASYYLIVDQLSSFLNVNPNEALWNFNYTRQLNSLRVLTYCKSNGVEVAEWLKSGSLESVNDGPLADCIGSTDFSSTNNELGLPTLPETTSQSSKFRQCVNNAVADLKPTCGEASQEATPEEIAQSRDKQIQLETEIQQLQVRIDQADNVAAAGFAGAGIALGAAAITGGGAAIPATIVATAGVVLSGAALFTGGVLRSTQIQRLEELRQEQTKFPGLLRCPAFDTSGDGDTVNSTWYEVDGDPLTVGEQLNNCICELHGSAISQLGGKVGELVNSTGLVGPFNGLCPDKKRKEAWDCLVDPRGDDGGIRPECMDHIGGPLDEDTKRAKMCQLIKCSGEGKPTAETINGEVSCGCDPGAAPEPEPGTVKDPSCENLVRCPTLSIFNNITHTLSSGKTFKSCGCKSVNLKHLEHCLNNPGPGDPLVFPSLCPPKVDECAKIPTGCPRPSPTLLPEFPGTLTGWTFQGGNAWDTADKFTQGHNSLSVTPGKTTLLIPTAKTTNYPYIGDALVMDVKLPASVPASGFKGEISAFAAINGTTEHYGSMDMSSYASDSWHTVKFELSPRQRRQFLEPNKVSLGLTVNTDEEAVEMVAIDGLRFVDNLEEQPEFSFEKLNTRPCSGSTALTGVEWTQFTSNGVYADIDTSACAFEETPAYFFTLEADAPLANQIVYGTSSVMAPTPTGFRVYISGGAITTLTADEQNWKINWQGSPKDTRDASHCTGSTKGNQNWIQGPSGWLAYLDVDTSACGYSETPRYFTSMRSDRSTHGHWRSIGSNTIISPTPSGFRVFFYYPYPHLVEAEKTSEIAKQIGAYIDWQAVPVESNPYCSGQSDAVWEQDGTHALTTFVKIDAEKCGITGTPKILTSITTTNPWAPRYMRTLATVTEMTEEGYRLKIKHNGRMYLSWANGGWVVNWKIIN